MTSHRDPLGVAIAIVTLILLLVAAAFIVECVLVSREVGHHAVDVLDQLHATLTDADRTVIIVGATATNIERTTRTWQAKQNALTDQTALTEQSLNRLLLSLNETAIRTSNLVAGQDQSLSTLEMAASQSFTKVGNATTTLEAGIGSLDQASATVARELPPILANLNATSAGAAATSSNVAATSADIRAFTHRELAPARGTWNVVKGFLRSFAGPAAQVATAVK